MSARTLARDLLAAAVLAVGGALLRSVVLRIRSADDAPAPARVPAASSPSRGVVARRPAVVRPRSPHTAQMQPPDEAYPLETEALLDLEPGADEFHLPAPTIWPIILAAGLTLAAFGITTFWVFSAAGLVLFVGAVAGWIAEVRHG